MYLLIVDAHSKWSEVFIMTSATSAKTIELLPYIVFILWSTRADSHR